MRLEIAVIVPTFNRAHLIAETIQSILNQTLPPAEIVVVDDGSTDGTGELINERFAGRVRYQRIENSGVCCARNTGVRFSTAPWIAFCDSDDVWKPKRLASQASLLAAVSGVEYVFTNFCYVHNGEWSLRDKFAESRAWLELLDSGRISEDFSYVAKPLYAMTLAFAPVFPSTVLMSRPHFDRIGGFDERWTRTSIEDLEFTLRCMQAPPFGVVREPLVGIRRHDSNASGDRIRDLLAYVDILRFSRAQHALGQENSGLIDRHIQEASVEAAELAFADRRLDVVARLLSPMERISLPPKMRWKRSIALLPGPLRNLAAGAILEAAALSRRVRAHR